jgi:two-component system, chemotaxis family, chemotaxis protein CheY
MPGRVLIVDDDAPTRLLLTDLLDDYEVQAAADGAEALARLATGHPDVILLDAMMPGMDGAAFMQAYQQTPTPHAPIVLLTAGTGAPQSGVAAFLGKPFDLDDLLGLVEQYVA